MSIGLKRGTVVLSEYSANWPIEYEQEKNALLNVAGDCIARIEHIGSTSVPSLIAKPIIDIGIEVHSRADLNRLVSLLPTDSYEYFGEREVKGDYFFAKGPASARTHYIHISITGSAHLSHYVKFRNALRSNQVLQMEYANLKTKLCFQYQSDRNTYTKLKGELITKVIGEIKPSHSNP